MQLCMHMWVYVRRKGPLLKELLGLKPFSLVIKRSRLIECKDYADWAEWCVMMESEITGWTAPRKSRENARVRDHGVP